MSKPIFYEKQIQDMWWVRLIVVVPTLIIWWKVIQQIGFGMPAGNNAMSNTMLIIFGVFMAALAYLMWTSNLQTWFYKDKIVYRFYPFHFKDHEIKWSDVKSATMVSYSPIKDYGGWGIRFGSKGNAYNVKGNIGLRLEMKKGLSILFGTQQADEMLQALQQAGKKVGDERAV